MHLFPHWTDAACQNHSESYECLDSPNLADGKHILLWVDI